MAGCQYLENLISLKSNHLLDSHPDITIKTSSSLGIAPTPGAGGFLPCLHASETSRGWAQVGGQVGRPGCSSNPVTYQSDGTKVQRELGVPTEPLADVSPGEECLWRAGGAGLHLLTCPGLPLWLFLGLEWHGLPPGEVVGTELALSLCVGWHPGSCFLQCP